MVVHASVPVTVLVVGGDPSLVESALDQGLDDSIEVTVTGVADLTTASNTFAVESPDCVIVQTDEIASETATAVERLRSFDADQPIVLITDDERDGSAGVAAGATDTILRDVAEKRATLLAARVRWAVDEVTETVLPGTVAWYDIMLDQSMDALSIVRADRTVSYHDVSVERLLGYKPQSIVGTDALNYVHPDDRARVRETFERLDERGDRASENIEYRFRHADGSWEWLESVVTARFDNEIGGYVVNSRLVTERKERELELEQAEVIFQNVRNGVFLVDVTDDERFEYQRVNDAYESITDLTETEIRGKTPGSVIPDPDVAAVIEADMAEVVESRSPNHDTKELRIDEGWRYFETWIAPVIVDDEVDSLVGVISDVTEQMERQRELELKNQAMDEAPIAISMVEPDGTDIPIVYANDGFEQLTGYEESEVIGDDWRLLGGEETDPETSAAFQEALTEEVAISTEMLYYLKDGTPKWAQVTVAPIRNADGEMTHFVGYHQDITELKEYETEIERRFDEFADMFAEDLRAPIDEARAAVAAARDDGDEEPLDVAVEWLERTDDLLADLATVHSFSVPSRDLSESALLGSTDSE